MKGHDNRSAAIGKLLLQEKLVTAFMGRDLSR